uniref:Uncharacterized protein MANES_05G034300 n=1 Tax=Rhizophora mucronata TaxID=61149 RepID=A0A2P2LZD0_RHIMU
MISFMKAVSTDGNASFHFGNQLVVISSLLIDLLLLN